MKMILELTNRWDPMVWKALLFVILTAQRIKTNLSNENDGALRTLPPAHLCNPGPCSCHLMSQLCRTPDRPRGLPASFCLWQLSASSTCVCLVNSFPPSHTGFRVASFGTCHPDNTLKIQLTFIFGWAGSSLLHGLLSRCGRRELRSSCGVWASLCSSFSCCGARALECGLSSCGAQA